ncbi:PREDICTED: ras-related protein Rab-15 isoform X1 [Rhinopithecus bieti]|nr:PREDICTED: ras-related protein Rab-15 isoform X1 [Rhinopithecus bieti]
MAKQYDVLFRLLLIGDSGVGKTCLLCRFTDNEFHSSHISTIGGAGAGRRGEEERRYGGAARIEFPGQSWEGVDFKMKTIEVDGIKVRIQIWDTAGQERYQTITKQYYRRAQGIFLVYDISSERSYQHIMKWVSDVDEYAPEGVQKILIGNKADEEQKRQVGREQGQQLAKEYGMDFYETSACTNLNIKESFTRLTELVLQAHRKELEGLRTRASNELALTELEEEEGKPEGPANSSKTCWC